MISIRGQIEEVSEKENELSYLMKEYGNQMKRYAYLMLKDEFLAEDAVQKTFINYYYKSDSYRKEASVKNYLYAILNNECKQIKRKNWYKREVRNDYDQIDTNSSEDKSIRRIVVQQCLIKIKLKYREILILYYYQEFTVQEISEILNLTVSAVKSRLKYAREQLRKYLPEEDFENEGR